MMWLPKGNPVRAGLVGAVVILAILAAAVLGPAALFAAKTADFHAQLANASGLKPDDPVYVAGIPAGRVTGVALAGNKVDVAFRLDRDTTLGTSTRASVKLMTILGRRYLNVEPSGGGRMRGGDTIPVDRTTVPYILDDLGRQARQTTEQLDLPRLRQLLKTFTEIAPKEPGQLGEALAGVSAVTRMVNQNDDQINQVLAGAQALTQSLLEQKDTFVSLLGNADLVLRTLVERKDAVTALISDVGKLTDVATTFLAEHKNELNSVLDELHSISGTLSANERNLAATIEKLGPFSRYLANVSGNGNWVDVAAPSAVIPDNVLCLAGLVSGCK
ncbi:MCE family protein [Amycolatopsis anabasis]|uniref:MCE family protein n=1 Tax=Amycolatopsis anabasis TaxID=1840409 RepID=UPI00131E70EA|nr:MCE family protein [Amycolatopsis anabasis]